MDRESVALHLAGEETRDIDRALVRVIVEEPGFWELYAPLLRTLHPNIWKEATSMARSRGKKSGLDLSPLIEEVGLEKYLEVVELGDIITTFGPKKLVKAIGIDQFLASLTAEERQQLKERLK